MEKENKQMTYDEALKRLEQIVSEIEKDVAITLSEYQIKAKEAKQLLDYCQQQLSDWEKSNL